MMNKLSLILLLSCLAVNFAQPHRNRGTYSTVRHRSGGLSSSIGKSQKQSNCRTEYKDVWDVEYETKYENKCETKYKKVCENTFERVCNPKREKKCETVYENECKTLQKQSCSTAYKNVPYEETECNDEYVRECPKKWEEKDGAKVWIPETEKCVNLKKSTCQLVKKSKKESYQKCENQPSQICSTAYKTVPFEETECNDEYVRECPKKWEEKDGAKVWIPETKKCVNLKKSKCQLVKKSKKEPYQKCENQQSCTKVPKQKCNWVTKQQCQRKRTPNCTQKPVQECKKVHTQVPKQVKKKKAIKVCN